MVGIAIHEERIGTPETHKMKIGEEWASKRAPHLTALAPVEELVRTKSPLAISYDVSRAQPPFFHEFTYTELMGNLLYVAPQSSEIAARVMAYAGANPPDDRWDVSAHIDLVDKYQLNDADPSPHKRVVFLPGSNIFNQCVSREWLEREMMRFPQTVIKPHPLTNEETLRRLGISFGYECIIDRNASSLPYLHGADVVSTPTSSELGLYATLLGKSIQNITTISFEARGVYNPIYRLLWDSSDPKATLHHLLNSPFSGIYHKDDPNIGSKMDKFFEVAMALRDLFKPLVREYSPDQYAGMVIGQPQHQPKEKPDAIRKN